MEKLGTESVKTFECENCEITFTEKESLQKHQDEFCKKYKCDKCESAFPLPELLEKHAIVHGKHGIERYVQIFNENATYKCLECGKGFKEEFFVFIHYKKEHDKWL